MFDNLERYLNLLKRNDPAMGYYPNPTKIIMKRHPNNVKVGGLFCANCGFQVYTNIRCFGCYISEISNPKDIGSKIGHYCTNYDNLTYLKLCKNYHTINDTTLVLLTSIEEVGNIHDVFNKLLAYLSSPNDLLTLVNKLNSVDLPGGEATLTKTLLEYVC